MRLDLDTLSQPFEMWLRKHNYSDATVKTSMLGLRLFLEGKRTPWIYNVSRRIRMAFPDHAQLAAQCDAFEDEILAAKKRLPGGRVGRAKKQRKQRAFDEHDWGRLVQSFAGDRTPMGLVLDLLAGTGLRIGDALRIDVGILMRGATHGYYDLTVKGDKSLLVEHAAAPEQWTQLRERMGASGASTVADLISPGSDASATGGAYQAVRRRLQMHCDELGITERVWLHRLRKTVGEQSYELGGHDLRAVQAALGHEHLPTSATYIDKARMKQATELHQARAAKFPRKPT